MRQPLEQKSLFLFALVIFGHCDYCKATHHVERKLGVIPVGDICNSSDDCLWHPEKTVCFDSGSDRRCWCKNDHVAIETPPVINCEPIRNAIGDECVHRDQCTSGIPGEWDCLPASTTQTASNVCNCTDGSFHKLGEHKCLKDAEQIGDPCETLEQCTHSLGDFSRCFEGRCDCIPWLSFPTPDNTKCLLIMNIIGGPCETDEQCRLEAPGNWSECKASDDSPSNGACQCQENAIREPGRHVCHRMAELIGDNCEFDAQCTANLGDIAECIMGRCQCKNGTPPGGTTCFEDVQNQLGGNCTVDSQCQRGQPGELSVCVNEKCACNTNATNKPGEHVCRRKADFVGDECLRNAQCKANLGDLSECLLGEICVCTPRYAVPSIANDRCLPVINFIGGECEERQQCTAGTPGTHSDCVDSPFVPGMKVCNCTNGAATEPGRHQCLRDETLIGDPCQTDEQCAGDPGTSSVCSAITNQCGCLGGYIPTARFDGCLPILNHIGNTCSLSRQCQLGIPGSLSECTERNICECSSSSAKEPDQDFCHSIVAFSDPCQVNVQCTESLGEYSQCVAGICECTKNASPDLPRKKCVLND